MTEPAAGVAPAMPSPDRARPAWWRRLGRFVVRYFREQDPTFWVALTPAIVVAAIVFVRSPASNYIFDEQEALLANPYVNGKVPWSKVLERDFWGLPSGRSIGSYRPLPNLIWRALWSVSKLPWLHHWVNVVLHAVNASLLASFTFAVTRNRRWSWLAGAVFLLSAVITEAVTGVVGIADVLGGLGVLLAAHSLRLRWWLMPFACFSALFIGFLSKESVLVALPLIGWMTLCLSPMLHRTRPQRVLRVLLASGSAVLALVAYTYLRRKFFPVTLPAELQQPLPDGTALPRVAMHEFLRWFQQPRLPADRINNPLVDADTPHRIAGALRVYARGLFQVVFPARLSGDYSFPQEPIPAKLLGWQTVVGGVALVLPVLAGVAAWAAALTAEINQRRAGNASAGRSAAIWALVAVGLLWVPIAYFPHSNIPMVLPTVRAERFWYLPVMGSAWLLSFLLMRALSSKYQRLALPAVSCFLAFQAIQGRLHALDYTNDLSFWRATSRASSQSAKAHLNYSVMVGAHERDLPKRLAINGRAKQLAPKWPMAHIYYGDTLCRMGRADAAFPHYVRGFELGPNDSSLIALALQCLWDKKAIKAHGDELLELSNKHPGTWLAYLASDIVYNGAKHKGVEQKYRPRGYDEGPKD